MPYESGRAMKKKVLDTLIYPQVIAQIMYNRSYERKINI